MRERYTDMPYESAIALAATRWWERATDRQIAEFQMTENRLCLPFDCFHEAVEKTLGRPVFTHEFGLNRDGLYAELFEGRETPSFEDILNLIPADKRVIVIP